MVQRQGGGGGARCGDQPAGPGERVSGEKEKEKGIWAVGAGLGQGEWCWAVAWGLGRSGGSLGRTGFGLFFRFLGLVSFLFFSLLFQTQLELNEFKHKFDFNPSTQTNKPMHQHECANKLALK